jgi:dienelactone hydrolase
MPMPPAEELRVPADAVHGTFFRPADTGRATTAIVIGGTGGGDAVSSGMARAFAKAGFAALGLGYFKVPGRPDDLRDIELEYFVDAVNCVRTRFDAGAVTLVGSSRGSEAALLVASHFPDVVDAVVGIVPANVAFGSWPPGGAGWTLDGQPVPAATSPTLPPPEECVIPVERIADPMLLVSAGKDEIWPSTSMASAVAERRRSLGRPCLHVDLASASHAVSFIAPITDPSARPEDVAARDEVWPQVLEFLRSVDGGE